MSQFPNEPTDATKKVLKSIDTLSNSLRTSAATNPSTVLHHINNYITNLQLLSAAGNTTSFPLKTDILRFLDEGDVSNPWLYMHKEFEACEKKAGDLAERKLFLEELRADIQQEIFAEQSSEAVSEGDNSAPPRV